MQNLLIRRGREGWERAAVLISFLEMQNGTGGHVMSHRLNSVNHQSQCHMSYGYAMGFFMTSELPVEFGESLSGAK